MALLVSLVGISSSKFQAGVVVYRLALSNEKSGFESCWYPLFLQPLESLIAIVLKKISNNEGLKDSLTIKKLRRGLEMSKGVYYFEFLLAEQVGSRRKIGGKND